MEVLLIDKIKGVAVNNTAKVRRLRYRKNNSIGVMISINERMKADPTINRVKKPLTHQRKTKLTCTNQEFAQY